MVDAVSEPPDPFGNHGLVPPALGMQAADGPHPPALSGLPQLKGAASLMLRYKDLALPPPRRASLNGGSVFRTPPGLGVGFCRDGLQPSLSLCLSPALISSLLQVSIRETTPLNPFSAQSSRSPLPQKPPAGAPISEERHQPEPRCPHAQS